jgi:transposase
MKKEHVILTNEHRTDLENLIKKGEMRARTYQRTIALLELDRGRTLTEVASIVGATKQTVSTWAKKYQASGLTFLTDKARPGRPRVIDGLSRAKITALACSAAPAGYARWSLRLLADKAVTLELVDDISHTEVGRILKKTNCNPTANDPGVSVR